MCVNKVLLVMSWLLQRRRKVASGPPGSLCEDDGPAHGCGDRLHGRSGAIAQCQFLRVLPSGRCFVRQMAPLQLSVAGLLKVFQDPDRESLPLPANGKLVVNYRTSRLAPLTTPRHLTMDAPAPFFVPCTRWRLGPTSCKCSRPWVDLLARTTSTTEPCRT